LAVATNRTHTTRPALRRVGLLERFDLIVTPLEAGVAKPDTKIIEMILGEMALGRDEVAFVGDSVVDEQLCIAAGVRLIAFRNPELSAWAHVDDFTRIPGLLDL
jgi:FMN phosphatase YigB (HAD superfamily)